MILYSNTINRYYVGYTNDIDRRISGHNRKKGKFTDKGIPWNLVYKEDFVNKTEAMDRERFIKSKKSSAFIKNLISTGR